MIKSRAVSSEGPAPTTKRGLRIRSSPVSNWKFLLLDGASHADDSAGELSGDLTSDLVSDPVICLAGDFASDLASERRLRNVLCA